jgi:hypothetical protein
MANIAKGKKTKIEEEIKGKREKKGQRKRPRKK